MKKIKLMLLCGLIMSAVSGCNFLDIVPDDTATMDDAFANELAAERFLRTCYSYQPLRANFLRSFTHMISDEIVPSPHWNADWFPFYQVLWGTNNSTSPFPVHGNRGYSTDMWQDCYQGIRQCYTFLANIESVVPTNTPQATYDRNKATWIGEAWFMIAYYHQLLFQQYGPIVVIEQLMADNTQLPRLPADEVVNKIVAFYDEALKTLPNENQDADYYGRATREAAMAMKAKALIYGASPLFNGSQLPYSELKDKEGQKLIPAYSKERWKTAMDAVKAAIDIAIQNGHALYTYSGDDPFTTKAGIDFLDPAQRRGYLNCRFIMVDGAPNRNRETIWGYTGDVESVGRGDIQEQGTIRGIEGRWSGSYPGRALSVSLQVAKLFYTANGKPVETDPGRGYNWEDRMVVPTGGHSANLHLGREPRFYAAVGYSGGVYEFNQSREYQIDLKRGENNSTYGWQAGSTVNEMSTDAMTSGYALKKMIHPDGTSSSSSYAMKVYPYVTMRLADLYLMYVEACAEYNGSLDATALGYLREIHDRAGLDGNNVYYAGYSGDELIKSIRRERMIELVFEGHWYYDLRRWLMADEWHNEGMWASAGQGEKNGMWGLNARGWTNEEFFQETQLNSANGITYTQKYDFNPERDYLFPIKTTHININERLVQNPGY